jgi:hypothetical protein
VYKSVCTIEEHNSKGEQQSLKQSYKFVLLFRIRDADERKLELEQKVKDLEKEKDEMSKRLVQVKQLQPFCYRKY